MRLKESEVEVLRSLWRCGIATRGQLSRSFNLQGNRLRSFEMAGYIVTHLDEVRLGDTGVSLCEEELFLQYRYRTSYRQTLHDLMLMQAYLSLPAENRATWKTESQLNAEFENDPRFAELKSEIARNGHSFCAVPDGAFFSCRFQGYVAVEVITKSYTEDRVMQKRRFADLFLSGIQLV